MDDAQVVGAAQSPKDLKQDLDGPAFAKPANGLQPGFERFAFEKLHHDVKAATTLAKVEHLHAVGVFESAGGLRFAA